MRNSTAIVWATLVSAALALALWIGIAMLPDNSDHPTLRAHQLARQKGSRHTGAPEEPGLGVKKPPSLDGYSAHTRHLLELLLAPGARPALVVRPEGGLSNRMRALASARAFAALTGRRLVAVWLQDAHCRAAFHDLFLTDDGTHVINEAVSVSVFLNAPDPW
jgi:hypothetical protein